MSDPYGSYYPNATPGWSGGPAQPMFTVERRPGTVTAAAVVTMVLSGLAMAGALVLAIVIAADPDEVRRQILENQSAGSTPPSPSQLNTIVTAMTVSSIVAIVFSVVAILLAIGVLRRSRIARILLTVLAAITILPALLASIGIVGLPWLAGAVVVIVLLYVGGANRWFSRNSQQPAYPSYPGYPRV